MHGAPPQPRKPFTVPSGRRLSARFARGVRGEGDFKVPSMHVEVDEDGYTVTACVPGVERDELHVALEGDILRLTGERRHEHVRSNGSREQARYFSRFTREVRLLRDEVKNGTPAGTVAKIPQ